MAAAKERLRDAIIELDALLRERDERVREGSAILTDFVVVANWDIFMPDGENDGSEVGTLYSDHGITAYRAIGLLQTGLHYELASLDEGD